MGNEFKALYLRDADAQSPAGGVSSSALDMAKWLSMNLAAGSVHGAPFIDPAALQEAHQPQVVNGPATIPAARSRFYGYGFNVETTSTGHLKLMHSGAFFVGAGTAFALIPAADVGIVVLTNGAPVGAAEAITTCFCDLVRTGTVERDWLAFFAPLFAGLLVNPSRLADKPAPAHPRPASPLSTYVGTYRNVYFDAIRVKATDKTLSITIGPKGYTADLTHWDGEVFSWEPPGGNGDPISAVTFTADKGGKAPTVVLEFFDTHGFGAFTRS